MNTFIMTLRAVGAELARRTYVPTVILAGGVFATVLVCAFWLTTLSDWWWLLFIPLTVAASVCICIALVVLLLIRSVRPKQNGEQKQAVKEFVDKLQGIAEVVGTPKFIILFRVLRSVAAPSKEKYLSDLVANKEIVNDFRTLQRLFTQQT